MKKKSDPAPETDRTVGLTTLTPADVDAQFYLGRRIPREREPTRILYRTREEGTILTADQFLALTIEERKGVEQL